MEHLEKLLYNAYEGCTIAMPMSPKVIYSSVIHRENMSNEWL